MLKIGIDLDDTINSLVSTWLEKYNKDYNDDVKIEDLKTWDIGDYTKAGKDFYKYLGDGETFKNLSIKDGAANIIEKLCENNEVYIVTANDSYNTGVCDDKVNFINKFMPFFPIKNIIFINNKSLLDLDVLIDDGLHNFMGFKGTKIVFDRPWNRDYKEHHWRMTEWSEKVLNAINLWY
jgi:5'(3')-deoxyribonucleotidase